LVPPPCALDEDSQKCGQRGANDDADECLHAALLIRTARMVHVLLRSALVDAVETGLLQVNPADAIPKKQRPTHRAGKAAGKHWEPAEAATFLQGTRFDRWAPLWALGLDTGARRGELLAVRWGDVDWDTPAVEFSRNRVVVNGDVVEGTPKSGEPRRVDIGAETVAALRHWRKAQLANTGASEFVFTDELGQPIHPDRVNHLFRQACKAAVRQACKAAGVSDIGPHGMRHTSATLALKGGGTAACGVRPAWPRRHDDHGEHLLPRAEGPAGRRRPSARHCALRGVVVSTTGLARLLCD
jgi:integrase